VPSLRHSTAPAPPSPADPEDWRPQLSGHGLRANAETLIEPGWDGVRVLARVTSGEARFADEDGEDCTAEFATVADALAASALTDDMILDGFLTSQPTQIVAGVPLATIEAPTAGRVMAAMFVGGRAMPATISERPFDTERPIAFVAIDLLRIDGSVLLEVPLLERKRLLDGALTPGEFVRVTPHVREPFGSFLVSWRGLGFRTIWLRDANGRYTPGRPNDAWSIRPMPAK